VLLLPLAGKRNAFALSRAPAGVLDGWARARAAKGISCCAGFHATSSVLDPHLRAAAARLALPPAAAPAPACYLCAVARHSFCGGRQQGE